MSAIGRTPRSFPFLWGSQAHSSGKLERRLPRNNNTSYKEETDTPSLSSTGLTEGHDIIQTRGLSNTALTSSGSRPHQIHSSAFSGIHSGAAHHPGCSF